MNRTDQLTAILGPVAENEAAKAAVAVKQPDRAITLLNSMRAEFDKVLPDVLPLDMFLRIALTGFRKTPELLECTQASLLGALMECARLGLPPCTDQAWLVPFKEKGEDDKPRSKAVTLIIGYPGYVQLMYRSGQVGQVEVEGVYEQDEWEYSIGDGGRFFHRPNILAADRGKVLFTYSFATLLGGGRTRVAIVPLAEALKLQTDYSRGRKDSAWRTNFEKMWLKTAIRRLQNYAPKSSELRRAIAVDGAVFDATGISTAAVIEGEATVIDGAESNSTAAVGAAENAEDPWAGFDAAPQRPTADTAAATS